MNESRKTFAAFVYETRFGKQWLKLAEKTTKEDGTVFFRNVVGLPLALERVPKHLTSEQLAEVNAKAVEVAGTAPTIAEIESLTQSSGIARRLRNLLIAA